MNHEPLRSCTEISALGANQKRFRIAWLLDTPPTNQFPFRRKDGARARGSVASRTSLTSARDLILIPVVEACSVYLAGNESVWMT